MKRKKKSIWKHPWLHAYACSTLCYTCQRIQQSKTVFPCKQLTQIFPRTLIGCFFIMAIRLLAALPSVGVKAANRYPSCQLCWDGACDDSSREETGKSSWYHTPRHHRNLVGEQQDEAFLASCIIYYTEKSSLINTFTCLFYYLWLVDFHTPWIQPCFFCHVIVSRRTKVWTQRSLATGVMLLEYVQNVVWWHQAFTWK